MFERTVASNGKTYVVSVTLAPNGKRMIRANGRIVAPPQNGDAIDCWFDVDGTRFHLSGSGDDLDLDPWVSLVDHRTAESDPFVRYRVVAFMTWGSLLFFGAGALALLVFAMQALNAPNAATLAAMSDSWAEVLENQDRILWWVRVFFLLEALVGAATVIGAVLLLKRVAWAPLLLEILTWCVPGVYLFVTMTVEPWIHHHVDLVLNRRDALLWYASFHSSIAKWLIVASIGAGVLLMFLRRDRLEARQRELMAA